MTRPTARDHAAFQRLAKKLLAIPELWKTPAMTTQEIWLYLLQSQNPEEPRISHKEIRGALAILTAQGKVYPFRQRDNRRVWIRHEHREEKKGNNHAWPRS